MCNGGLCITIHLGEKQRTLPINNRGCGWHVDVEALMQGSFLEKQEDSGDRVQMPEYMRGTVPTASLAVPSGKMGINLPPSRVLSAQGCYTAGADRMLIQ